MIRRGLLLLMVCCLCCSSAASAADVPFSTVRKAQVKKAEPKRTKPKLAVATPAPKEAATPALASDPDIDNPDAAPSDNKAASRNLDVEPASNEIDLAWVLDPLVANADGSKLEGSSSMEGNLIVVEPGIVSSPYMVIKLTGHIVKTPRTTARIDVTIGGTSRTIAWQADDVQSGRFSVELKAPMKEGQLPGYFPVSALAFVTKDGKDGAAMVSLEKIVVRVGKVTMVSSQ